VVGAAAADPVVFHKDGTPAGRSVRKFFLGELSPCICVDTATNQAVHPFFCVDRADLDCYSANQVVKTVNADRRGSEAVVFSKLRSFSTREFASLT